MKHYSFLGILLAIVISVTAATVGCDDGDKEEDSPYTCSNAVSNIQNQVEAAEDAGQISAICSVLDDLFDYVYYEYGSAYVPGWWYTESDCNMYYDTEVAPYLNDLYSDIRFWCSDEPWSSLAIRCNVDAGSIYDLDYCIGL